MGPICEIYDRENRGLVNYGHDSVHMSMQCCTLVIMALLRYFKKVSLPNPDGALSDHILLAAIASANSEVKDLVAEDKKVKKHSR